MYYIWKVADNVESISGADLKLDWSFNCKMLQPRSEKKCSLLSSTELPVNILCLKDSCSPVFIQTTQASAT